MARNLLYYPYDKGKSLVKQYPELAKVKEFSGLKPAEQLFVWLYACKSSYLLKGKTETSSTLRAKKAYEIAFEGQKWVAEEYEAYCECRFPEKIKVACEWMSKRDPNIRARAKEALSKQFDNMLAIMTEEIPETEVSEDDEGHTITSTITPQAKKAHVEARQKAREEMMAILPVIEEGLSIATVDEGEEDESAVEEMIREQRLSAS